MWPSSPKSLTVDAENEIEVAILLHNSIEEFVHFPWFWIQENACLQKHR